MEDEIPLHCDEELTWERDVVRGGSGPTSQELAAMRSLWRPPRKGVQVEALYVPHHKRFARSKATVHFTGRLASSGAVFDGTWFKKSPLSFDVGKGRVVPGFEAGVLQTRLGGASRVRVAGSEAYPGGAARSIEPGAPIVFDVVVVSADGVDASADDIAAAELATRPRSDDALLAWWPSEEIRSYLRARVDPLGRVGGRPIPPHEGTWTGADEVSGRGLCVSARRSPDVPRNWTWDELCDAPWAQRARALAKAKAPIRSTDPSLRAAPVVEVTVADFSKFCLRVDHSPYYLNGWELFVQDPNVWGGGSVLPPLDQFPDVEDLSGRLLLEFETQANARIFGPSQKGEALAAATATDASTRLTKAFIGPRGATTRLHRDNHGAHARLTVLHGSKLYVAFSPADKANLYADDAGHSPVDVLSPDLDEYPLYARAIPYAAIVRAGETLLVPRNWYHFAVSLTPSVTVMRNFWNATNVDDFNLMQRAILERKLGVLRDAGMLRRESNTKNQQAG
ncbi:hypothetical protein CTAYLR_002229 [Chrysophaeum taylorii]|uniref:peptidylprolyl isomerase n=1 Tax=Chrysophaeum taylorii TaxID=2483200 RepID=A0AAD7UPJ6_9STRA|nr:hypothetical protein CTAYLR_002229 [Chrysophaeum taylorii]